jgi:hypothetical protein
LAHQFVAIVAAVDGASPHEAFAVFGELVLLHLVSGNVRYVVLFVDFISYVLGF